MAAMAIHAAQRNHGYGFIPVHCGPAVHVYKHGRGSKQTTETFALSRREHASYPKLDFFSQKTRNNTVNIPR